MKPKILLTSLLLSLSAPGIFAAEVTLVDWNHTWKYFHPESDDPTVDDATIDNTGAGVAPNAGPDLIYANFNGTTNPAGAWFAKESDFTAVGGYEDLFGKGFDIDGTLVGAATNYSSYDGGQGPGPLGYDVINYFGATPEANLTAFGTTLIRPADNRHFAAYFRTTFIAGQAYTKPTIRMLLDDSAVIYYDGVSVARVNRDNSNIAYTDAGATDTTATNNELGTAAGNEDRIQAFRLDTAGGPGRATATPGAQADSFVTVAIPKITAGTHTIAIIVRNSGNNSSDMVMGFQLKGDDAGISAIVNSTTRLPGVDPVDPSDDEFTASVTVTKLGTLSATWTSDVLPQGTPPYQYDTPYTFGPFPASASQTVNFTATGDPLLTAVAVLTAPPVASVIVGTNSLPGDPVIRVTSNYAPWTQMAGLPANRRIQLNNGSALGGINTDPISLTPGTPKCVILSLEYNDNSTGSNAETGDSIKVELVTDVGTVNLTSAYDDDGTSPANGAAMNGEDDAALTSGDELNPDSLPENYTFTARWLLAGVVPANATTVQVRISANNDSASETLRIGNIQLRPCVDTDGDGVLDIWEEVAGTDSSDANSSFKEVSHVVAAGSTTITVTSVPTRTYQVYSSTDLLNWLRDTPVSTTPPLLFDMNTPGTGANLPLRRTNANPARIFWKVKVHLPTTDIVSP